jgi:hypothetical protein
MCDYTVWTETAIGEEWACIKKCKYNDLSSIIIIITTTTTIITSLFVSKCHDFYLCYLTVVTLIPLHFFLLDDGIKTLSHIPSAAT